MNRNQQKAQLRDAQRSNYFAFSRYGDQFEEISNNFLNGKKYFFLQIYYTLCPWRLLHYIAYLLRVIMMEDEGQVGEETPGVVDSEDIKQMPHCSIGALVGEQ